MSTKGFLLLVITVVVIGGSVGGAFSGGLALGRSQSGDAVPETAFLQGFAGGQISSNDFPGGRPPGGGLTAGQFGGGTADGPLIRSEGESPAGQDAPTGFRTGAFGGRGGFGGVVSGTVGTVDGDVFTVTTDSGETQVSLDANSAIQVYRAGTAGDLSPGDRVLVIVTGGSESGEPVVAASVIVNPPEGGGIFGAGGFGADGFGGRPRSR